MVLAESARTRRILLHSPPIINALLGWELTIPLAYFFAAKYSGNSPKNR